MDLLFGVVAVFACLSIISARSIDPSWTPDCTPHRGKIPRLLPHPTDCHSMFVCLQGAPRRYFCPGSEVFDVRIQGCVASEECEKEEDDEVKAFRDCPRVNGQDVVLFPHPTDCGMYYVCDHGVAYPRECPPKLHYNPELRVCDYPYRANCKARVFKLQIEEIYGKKKYGINTSCSLMKLIDQRYIQGAPKMTKRFRKKEKLTDPSTSVDS